MAYYYCSYRQRSHSDHCIDPDCRGLWSSGMVSLYIQSFLLLKLFSGNHIRSEARVHVGGLDGDLSAGVCPTSLSLRKVVDQQILQLPGIQLLPSIIFILVHGRFQLG